MDLAVCRQPGAGAAHTGEGYGNGECLSAALCAAAVWDGTRLLESSITEKQSVETEKSFLNPLHLHKPLLSVVYWILQARLCWELSAEHTVSSDGTAAFLAF